MRKVCYLKVLPEYDNKNMYEANGGGYRLRRVLIRNELLTLSEVANCNISLSCFQIVKVDKSSVYYRFGARFSDQYSY